MFFHTILQRLVLVIGILRFSCSSCEEQYAFSYVVDAEGLLSQQSEEGSDDIITGSYSFLQPDGKIRVVRYKADGDKGFRAFIIYRRINRKNKGHLKFPRDFQHPIWFARPVSTIPRSFLGPENYPKKHHQR